ncbi:hypothetical protein BaRGS_00006769, partial [Batillaria attramentaria]
WKDKTRGEIGEQVYNAVQQETPDATEQEINDATEQRITGETEKRITNFLSSVVVGVNTLYDSVKKYGLNLDVRLKKVHILLRDLWEGNELRFGFTDQIATNTAIDKFYHWTWSNRDTLGLFDHAMLITGYDVIDSRDPEKLTKGVAYKGVMCKYGSVSVVENTFTYQMIDTAAHELGHSLGSDHDGENNYCDNNRGFVMSSRTEINSTDRWSFSPCSAEAMKLNIADLNQVGANCLVKTYTQPTPGLELGALFTADQQCKLIMGPEAFFCRDFYDDPAVYEKMCTSLSEYAVSYLQDFYDDPADFYDDPAVYEKMCTSMWCSASIKESHCQNHIASDGFVCGNKKVCKRGFCVPDKSSKPIEAPDTCPQGDQPGIVYQNLTCSEVARQKPWLCYGTFFQRKCCLTCPSIKEDVEGCEYGDKEEWCATDMKYPYDCYLNEKICCKSCARYKRPKDVGCEFGDHSIECRTKLNLPIGCYANEKLCCETCPKHKTKDPKCPYGDKSTWCQDKLEVPNGCYLNKDLCCGTCSSEANYTSPMPDKKPGSTGDGVADCMFGDRYPEWCSKQEPYQCSNATIEEWCCKTCAQYKNLSRPGCEYGDKYKNCEELVYPYACYYEGNADACCWTCSMYKNDTRPECPYGDKQAWCYKLNAKYTRDQWCHLDKEHGHCCGTCLYDETAIPVFGSKVKGSGVPDPL